MNVPEQSRTPRRSWRAFPRRDGRLIERQLYHSSALYCPECGDVLEARPASRIRRRLPLDASGYDLDCRRCRRFWIVVRHTARSVRLIRMRRFVAALRAVELEAAVPAGTAAA